MFSKNLNNVTVNESLNILKSLDEHFQDVAFNILKALAEMNDSNKTSSTQKRSPS